MIASKHCLLLGLSKLRGMQVHAEPTVNTVKGSSNACTEFNCPAAKFVARGADRRIGCCQVQNKRLCRGREVVVQKKRRCTQLAHLFLKVFPMGKARCKLQTHLEHFLA